MTPVMMYGMPPDLTRPVLTEEEVRRALDTVRTYTEPKDTAQLRLLVEAIGGLMAAVEEQAQMMRDMKCQLDKLTKDKRGAKKPGRSRR